MSSIDLIEENKRLSKELLFANQCLNVLIEFKTFVDSVFGSILEQNLNENQCKKYKEINKRVFEVFSKRDDLNIGVYNIGANDNLNLNPIKIEQDQFDDDFASIESQNECIGEDVSEETILDTNSGEEYNINEGNECLTFGSQLIRQKLSEECVANNSDLKDKDIDNDILVCDDIGCQFQTKNQITLKHHKQMNHSKRFVCSYSGCQFKTLTKYNLVRHHKTHERKTNAEEVTIIETKLQTDKTFVCDYPECQYQTHTKANLNSHKKKHKQKTTQKKIIEEPVKTQEMDVTHWTKVIGGKIRFLCDFNYCKFLTHDKSRFIGHINGHKGVKPYQCPHCDLSFVSENYLKQHFNRKHKLSETALICQIDGCGRQYNTSRAFRSHQRDYHFKEKIFVCDFPDCGYRGYSPKQLESHKLVHGVEGPIKCPVEDCPKTFSFESQLKIHMSCHSTERNFECPRKGCDSRLKSKMSVAVHLRVVHGDKKFQCEWPGCDFRASVQGIINAHMRYHSDERKFVCDWDGCEFKGKTKCILDDHKRKVHLNLRPHACSWPGCTHRAKNRAQLNNHMVVHTNERKFSCDWKGCQHKCKTSAALMYHKRTHTNERPFGCPHPGCDYRSSQSGGVKTHMRTHMK